MVCVKNLSCTSPLNFAHANKQIRNRSRPLGPLNLHHPSYDRDEADSYLSMMIIVAQIVEWYHLYCVDIVRLITGNDESVRGREMIVWVNGARTTILSTSVKPSSWLLTLEESQGTTYLSSSASWCWRESITSSSWACISLKICPGPTHWWNHKESPLTPLLRKKIEKIWYAKVDSLNKAKIDAMD